MNLFSIPAPFDEVNPLIDEIRVKVVEEGYMVTQKQSATMTKANIRPDFSCGIFHAVTVELIFNR